jgi:hypothetical protein
VPEQQYAYHHDPEGLGPKLPIQNIGDALGYRTRHFQN